MNVTPNRMYKFTLEDTAEKRHYTDKTIRLKSFLMSEYDLSMFHEKNILPKIADL